MLSEFLFKLLNGVGPVDRLGCLIVIDNLLSEEVSRPETTYELLPNLGYFIVKLLVKLSTMLCAPSVAQ
jgi:hypothetical protein